PNTGAYYMNRKLSLGLASIAIVLLVSACATPRRTSADADALVTTALVDNHSYDQPRESLRLLAQASAVEPKRPEFAWLYLAQCINIANCNPQPIEAKLHELDPENGAASLGSLSRAARAKDARAVQARMREIGKSRRFDIYWNPNIVHVANVLS